MAQQVAEAAEEATAPFQYPLRTRAGTECVSHIMQSLTDLDPRNTILSVDGVGAFDLISSNSMMQGLLHMEGGEKLLPFVRMFHSTPSTFLWEDEEGTVHHNTSHRVKAASRVTPLIPMLFASGRHSSLVTTVSDRLHGRFMSQIRTYVDFPQQEKAQNETKLGPLLFPFLVPPALSRRTAPPPDHPSAGPLLPRTAQNFALFSPLPAPIFALSLSGGSSREIFVVFEAPGPLNVHVWSSRAVV